VTAGFLGWGIVIVILAYRSGLIDAGRIASVTRRRVSSHGI
jgi:hypothetical protein